MNDAQIFHDNIKRICKKYGHRMAKIDALAGFWKGNTCVMAKHGSGVTTLHIKRYAKALEVEPAELMEGMFDAY